MRGGNRLQHQKTHTPAGIVQAKSRRASLLVFGIRPKIAKEDREWMERRADAVFDAPDRIDLLLIMTGNGGARPCAVLDRDTAWVMMRALKDVRRKGRAPRQAGARIALFKWTTPVEGKAFALQELLQARRGIDAA